MPSNGETVIEDDIYGRNKEGDRKEANGNDCLSCKLIGTTFLASSGGYVLIQGKKWERGPARMASVFAAIGLFGLAIIRALK